MIYTYVLNGSQKCEYFVVKTDYKRSHFKKVLKQGYVIYKKKNLKNSKIYGGLFDEKNTTEKMEETLNNYNKKGIIYKHSVYDGLFKIIKYTPSKTS